MSYHLSLNPRYGLTHIHCSVDIWWSQRIPAKCITFLDCFGKNFLSFLFAWTPWYSSRVIYRNHPEIFFFSVRGSFTPTLSIAHRAIFPGCDLEAVIQWASHPFQKWVKHLPGGRHLRSSKQYSWRLRWQRICLQWRRPGFDPWVREIP